MNNHYEGGPRARAVTWEEFQRNGGGGGGPGGPDREPSWLGQKFREWAAYLINKEKSNLDSEGVLEPVVYKAVYDRKKELAQEFNRLQKPGIDVTIAAVKTVLRYNFGLSVPTLQNI